MNRRFPYCHCTHTSLAHSGAGWCRVLLCDCRRFQLKAAIIKANTETNPLQPNNTNAHSELDDLAATAMQQLNARLGIKAFLTNSVFIVRGFAGEHGDTELIEGKGSSFSAALRDLLRQINPGGNDEGLQQNNQLQLR